MRPFIAWPGRTSSICDASSATRKCVCAASSTITVGLPATLMQWHHGLGLRGHQDPCTGIPVENGINVTGCPLSFLLRCYLETLMILLGPFLLSVSISLSVRRTWP